MWLTCCWMLVLLKIRLGCWLNWLDLVVVERREEMLDISMSYDGYKDAVAAVQNLLDEVRAVVVEGVEGEAELEGMPSADDIVDLVWDKITY